MSEDKSEIKEAHQLSEEYIDVTEEITEHRTGKVLDCPNCGQGIGTSYGEDKRHIKCQTCDKILIDTKAGDRPEDNEEEQTSLMEW